MAGVSPEISLCDYEKWTVYISIHRLHNFKN